MTYGYEQLSLAGHVQVLKVAAFGSTGRWEKERTKTKLRKDKNKGGRDKLPLTSDFITKNELKIFTNVKLFTRGLFHEFIFYIN